MSATFLSYVRTLFGREERADCTVHFYLQAGGESGPEHVVKRQRTADATTKGHAVGEPLPAHLFVLSPGSAYFKAQADTWESVRQPQQPGGSKPQLRVALYGAEELPHALAAIRFIYTGNLANSDGPAALLQVRRLAGRLQVALGVAACDAALLALLSPPALASVVSNVVKLYISRSLLPARADDAHAPKLLRRLCSACRGVLARNLGTVFLSVKIGRTGVSLCELLGWSFRGAPSLLSDPAAKTQMTALPAAAMEALLGSECFATDNEASVLLMLAEWLAANPTATSQTKETLCKLIRLSQLDDAYLHGILPELTWFPISCQERRFLCQYAAANAARRPKLAAAVSGKVDCSAVWYGARTAAGTLRRRQGIRVEHRSGGHRAMAGAGR